MVQKLVLMTLLVCAPVVLTAVNAGDVPVIHKFEFWGKMSPYERGIFYLGWTNGFFVARGTSWNGARDLP